jgi:osmoprotectant transport system permease protein
LPAVVAGLRIAATTTISAATIAAYINAGGLGAIILTGIAQSFMVKIALGAAVAALFAIATDLGLARLEARLRSRLAVA